MGELLRMSADDASPFHLVLIDSWEQLVENFDVDSAVMHNLLKLLREGRSTGIRIVATGDVKLASSPRTRDRFGMKLVLPLATPQSYLDLGIGRQVPIPPAIPGRALLLPDLVAAQVAVVSPDDPSAFGQQEALRARAENMPDPVGDANRLVVAELPVSYTHLTLPTICSV